MRCVVSKGWGTLVLANGCPLAGLQNRFLAAVDHCCCFCYSLGHKGVMECQNSFGGSTI